MATHTPSEHQAAIYDAVRYGTGDIMVNSVAGSGKTYTIEEITKILNTRRAIVLAFNKHIADEVQGRLKGTNVTATTIHAFGYRALLRSLYTVKLEPKVDGAKYTKIARVYVNATLSRELRVLVDQNDQDAKQLVDGRTRALSQLVNMARLTLTYSDDYAALADLMSKYGIVTDGPEGDAIVIAGVRPVLDNGIDAATKEKVFDYTDMIWLPLILRVRIDLFDWVLVDECQDLNACQLALVLRLRALGGRYVFVGDEFQAIMGFSGADAHSFRKIAETTGAAILPLSVCYRCPSSHLEIARQYVPHIQDRPNAPKGTIRTVSEDDAPRQIGTGAMVLCRMTAPLVALCLKLIASGKPARVRGKEIGTGLIELAQNIGRLAGMNGGFIETLDQWEAGQIERLQERDNAEVLIDAVRDRCEALRVLYTEYGATLAGLCAKITEIFKDEKASITLSTIHRAKGLEADDVFILYPEILPLERPGMTEDQYQQEVNVTYVAYTRSRDRLTLIERRKSA